MRRRQIHLDFHTSPLIGDVGRDFDPDAFADTLAAAHVNSATCFAKCHHGMFYYDSKVGPRHPALRLDLLAAMIDACHRRDILVPAYVSVGWDEHAALTHPEWRLVTPDGRLDGPLPYGRGSESAPYASWRTLCLQTGYRAYLADTVREVLAGYSVDGLFFDICMDQESCSEPALAKMRQQGFDPADLTDRRRFARTEAIAFLDEFYKLVQRERPGLPVFFNGRVDVPMRDALPHLSHLEVESLPSGQWGYDHVQRMGRYARRLGKPWLVMTARFHRSWGDFGTLKNTAALEYEALTAVAMGAGVSIGDQLHPRGRLEPAVYDRIGAVFARLKALEPWSDGAEPVAQIGVLSALTQPDVRQRHPGGADNALAVDRGVTAMLKEAHLLFDLLDMESDFADYEVLVFPDRIEPEPGLLRRLKRYLSGGGRVFATHRFADPIVGVEHLGELEHDPFHLRTKRGFAHDLPAMDHCIHAAGMRVRPTRGAKPVAHVVAPYFNRTAEHFSSHGQTPPARLTRDPAIVLTRCTAYLNAPLFTAYAKQANRIYRDLVVRCIEHLLPDRVIRTSLPSTAEVSVLDQRIGPEAGRPGGREPWVPHPLRSRDGGPTPRASGRLGGRPLRGFRRIVHLLHYPATRRAPELDVIEESLPLRDVAIDLACPGKVDGVCTVPQAQPLPFEQAAGRVRFIVPEVPGHQAVCVTMTQPKKKGRTS